MVIAVIGLLASIVLVSLGPAREKARLAVAQQLASQVSHAVGAEAVGIWRFENISGNTTPDSSGYGNTGTLVGSPSLVQGIFSNTQAINLSGGAQYIDAGNGTSLQITGTITLAAWVKTSAGSGSRNVISKRTGVSGFEIVYYDSGYLNFFLGGGAEQVQYAVNLEDGLWHHVAGTFNGTVMRMYLDGVRVGPEISSNPVSNAAVPLTIGSKGASQYWQGVIDEVLVSREFFTAEEIKDLYAQGRMFLQLVRAGDM